MSDPELHPTPYYLVAENFFHNQGPRDLRVDPPHHPPPLSLEGLRKGGGTYCHPRLPASLMFAFTTRVIARALVVQLSGPPLRRCILRRVRAGPHVVYGGSVRVVDEGGRARVQLTPSRLSGGEASSSKVVFSSSEPIPGPHSQPPPPSSGGMLSTRTQASANPAAAPTPHSERRPGTTIHVKHARRMLNLLWRVTTPAVLPVRPLYREGCL